MARTAGSHAQTTAPKVKAAALTLFSRHGYAAVSMRQIAAEVGVQAGALYTYTPDKQTLLFSLMHDHMTELLAEWGRYVSDTDPLARLLGFVRCHLAVSHTHLTLPTIYSVSISVLAVALTKKMPTIDVFVISATIRQQPTTTQ